MGGKSIHLIMEEIFGVLKKEKQQSIRQLSIKIGSQWITIEKALNSLRRLGLVNEKFGDNTNRRIRLFSLKEFI